MKKIVQQYWISTAFCIIILVLCFINPPEIKNIHPPTNFDKFVHFVLFSVLSVLVFWNNTLALKRKIPFTRIFLGSFLFPLIFSGLIEIGQEYLTLTRTGDWMDFLFDGIGASIGWFICLLLNRKIETTQRYDNA